MTLNELLIDKRETSFDYTYSLIQLNIPNTYEVFNLGVILKDKQHINFKVVPSVFELANCLNLDGLSGTGFALQLATDRIKNNKTITPGKVSDEIIITPLYSYRTPLAFDKALDELFDENVTIMKGLNKKEKTQNIYDKPHILKNLKELVSKKKYNSIGFGKSINKTHKKVDIVGFGQDEHDKKFPIAGVEVVSPYVNDFMKNFAESFIVIKELETNEDIKLKLLYMPILEVMTSTQKKHYQTARNLALNSQIEIVDSKDYQELLGRVETFSNKYNQKLF